MLKTKFFLGVIFLTVFLGGCNGVKDAQQQVQNTTQKVAEKAASANPFTSIKDAISKSLSLQCTFVDEQGRQTKTYIKNGAVRADYTGQTNDQSQSVVMKDKKVYFWNPTTKEGFVMDIPEENISPTPNVSGRPKPSGVVNNQGMNPQDILEAMEKFKDSCKPAVVDEALFATPTDVTFRELSKLMMPISSPEGSKTMDPEQIQKMMQQYAPNN